MQLNIISSQEIVFQGSVSSVTLPGQLGAFTVLKNHAALISTLIKGEISYSAEDGGAESSIDIDGGIVDVENNVISVCLY